MTEENRHGHLQLIRGGKRLQHLLDQEFIYGSFEKALEHCEYLLKILEISGIVSGKSEDKMTSLKQAILETLQVGGYCLRVENFPPIEEMERLAQSLGINFGLIDFMAETEDPELPFKNLEKHFHEAADRLHRAAWVTTFEELQYDLQKKGFEELSPDLVRVAFFEINRDRTVPLVLVLPNFHHAYNPFPVLMLGDFHIPAIVARLLHLFDR